jgi:hypothetical protein
MSDELLPLPTSVSNNPPAEEEVTPPPPKPKRPNPVPLARDSIVTQQLEQAAQQIQMAEQMMHQPPPPPAPSREEVIKAQVQAFSGAQTERLAKASRDEVKKLKAQRDAVEVLEQDPAIQIELEDLSYKLNRLKQVFQTQFNQFPWKKGDYKPSDGLKYLTNHYESIRKMLNTDFGPNAIKMLLLEFTSWATAFSTSAGAPTSRVQMAIEEAANAGTFDQEVMEISILYSSWFEMGPAGRLGFKLMNIIGQAVKSELRDNAIRAYQESQRAGSTTAGL